MSAAGLVGDVACDADGLYDQDTGHVTGNLKGVVMSSDRPTLRTVAQAAGVSHQTISRVFKGDPAVSAEIRARVMQVAREQNYRPSAAARSLSRGRSDVVSFVAPYDSDSLFADPHILEVLHGATRALAARKQRLLLSLPSNAHERDSVFADVLAEKVADALIVEAGMGDERFQAIMAAGYPFVVVGYTTLPVASVRGDDEGGAYALAQHLLALGHRRIGVIDGPTADHLVLDARKAGLRRALADARSGEIVAFATGDFSVDSGAATVAQIMQTPGPVPTAIFAMNDRMALGAIQWLKAHDYRVPEDVSVTGFDDIAASSLTTPTLTTVRISSAELGERAVEMLLDSGLEPVNRTEVIAIAVRVRESTAPAHA
jgi:DNA-binding LacI/PurR family transcriptional regulator